MLLTFVQVIRICIYIYTYIYIFTALKPTYITPHEKEFAFKLGLASVGLDDQRNSVRKCIDGIASYLRTAGHSCATWARDLRTKVTSALKKNLMTDVGFFPKNIRCAEIKAERYVYSGWHEPYALLSQGIVEQHYALDESAPKMVPSSMLQAENEGLL